MKKLLLTFLLLNSFYSYSCADLRNVEKHMINSKASAAELLMMSINRLGYGVHANSWLNTKMISLIERNYGKRVAVMMMADELRKSFKFMETTKYLPYGRHSIIHPNGFDISPYGKSPVEIKAYRREKMNEHGLIFSQVNSILRQALQKRKVIDAVNITNYNVNAQLLDFWFNHFNIQSRKAKPYDTNYLGTIKRSMCGTFASMLTKTATHPAMMIYLDNVKNTREIKRNGVIVSSLNENYGREVVELHTLGTGPVTGYNDAGNPIYAYYVGDAHKYDEVLEATKVLTGWGMNFKEGNFLYRDNFHEKGNKVFPKMFGKRVVIGEGFNQGVRFLKLLANHNRTKRNICRKLGKSVYGMKPPIEDFQRCVNAWGKDGNLKAMYTAYVNSKNFWSRDLMLRGNKTPFESVISASRALGHHLNPRRFQGDSLHLEAFSLVKSIEELGEPIYNTAEPTGIKYNSSILHASTFVSNRIDKVNQKLERHFNRLVLDDGIKSGQKKVLWHKSLNRHVASVQKKHGNRAAYNLIMNDISPVFYPYTVNILREPMLKNFNKVDKLDGENDLVKSTLIRAVSSGTFLRK